MRSKREATSRAVTVIVHVQGDTERISRTTIIVKYSVAQSIRFAVAAALENNHSGT